MYEDTIEARVAQGNKFRSAGLAVGLGLSVALMGGGIWLGQQDNVWNQATEETTTTTESTTPPTKGTYRPGARITLVDPYYIPPSTESTTTTTTTAPPRVIVVTETTIVVDQQSVVVYKDRPTTVKPPPRPTCDPNYSGYCVDPRSGDNRFRKNCEEIGVVFFVKSDHNDPYGYDRDADGTCCEQNG